MNMPDWLRRAHLFRALDGTLVDRNWRRSHPAWQEPACKRRTLFVENIKAGYFAAGCLATLAVVAFCHFLLGPVAGWLIRVLA